VLYGEREVPSLCDRAEYKFREEREEPKPRPIEEHESRASREAATDRKHPMSLPLRFSGGLAATVS
jgi:hypothetical protein